MSESHLLSIGFIPAEHVGGTISCGDPDGSGTREITVEIGEDTEEDDYGEFQNSDGEFNGKYYVRYQFEEDGEYFNEKVVIV